VNDFLLIVCVEVFERKRGGWSSDDGGGVLMRKPHCSLLTAHCCLNPSLTFVDAGHHFCKPLGFRTMDE
jgi:hypothetical protein